MRLRCGFNSRPRYHQGDIVASKTALAEYERRKEIVRSLVLNGASSHAIERQTGIPWSTVRRIVKEVREGKAYTPAPLPESAAMTKTTVQYDGNGTPIMEWRRLIPGIAEVKEFVAGLAETVRGHGAIHKVRPSAPASADLMLEIPVFDAHIGKYSWAQECGPDQDWSTDIGTDLYKAGVLQVVSRSPVCEEALVVFGGDYFHADSRSNQTEASRNALDVDSRYGRNIRAGASLAKFIVDAALKVAHKVRVVVLKGNHSWHSEDWLHVVISAYYEGSTRVQVIDSIPPRVYIEHGKCLIGVAHGDKVRMQDFPSLMAIEAPEKWARSQYRHFHLGHIHKSKIAQPTMLDTHVGCTVEYLPSLTSTDAWHSEMGYVNPLRVMEGFLWHREYGCVTRMTVPFNQVRDNLSAVRGKT